jgi:hypothetical protein
MTIYFGKHYNLMASERGGIVKGHVQLDQQKVANLVKEFAQRGDVLILSANKEKLVQEGVNPAWIFEWKNTFRNADSAIVLTDDDVFAFQDEYPIFEAAGLKESYLEYLAKRPQAAEIKIYRDLRSNVVSE